MTAAHNILRKLRALGTHIEYADGRLVLRAGDRPIPKLLLEEARAAKLKLLDLLGGSSLLRPPKSPNTYDGGGLSIGAPENPSIPAAIPKTAKADSVVAVLGGFGGGLRGDGVLLDDDGGLRDLAAKTAITKSTLAVLDKTQHLCGSETPPETKTATSPECLGEAVPKPRRCSPSEQTEPQPLV